jgi:hypothetical protein
MVSRTGIDDHKVTGAVLFSHHLAFEHNPTALPDTHLNRGFGGAAHLREI